MSKRSGAKWTVNECLRLQREFELLGLTIGEIAELHKRTPKAIMYKLDAEGFADYKEILTKMDSSSRGDEYSNECCKMEADESESDDAEVDDAEVDDAEVDDAEVDESKADESKAEQAEADESKVDGSEAEPIQESKEECSCKCCKKSNQNNPPKKSGFKRFVSKIMKKLF